MDIRARCPNTIRIRTLLLMLSFSVIIFISISSIKRSLQLPTLTRAVDLDDSDAVEERQPVYFHSHDDDGHQHENREEAERLEREIRVLCWVMTSPANHAKKAVHIKATWGKRCNKLLFISDADDDSLPAINIGVEIGREHLWAKTKAAFVYIHKNYIDEYDWFMKADDDTYVIVENLRYMLSSYDRDIPIYFGSRFKKFTEQGYMSGGGGYVLSRAAVKLFVEVALPDATKCKTMPHGAEDAEIGKCLYNVGVMAGDSRDSHGHGRFFPFSAAAHFTKGEIPENMWYWDYIYYPIKNGPECCSDLAVTFHYIKPPRMYEMEYLIYHVHPYGVRLIDTFPAELPPDKKSIPKQVLEKYAKKDNTTTNS